MDAKTFIIEPLLERAEQYGKTSFELIKLRSINKTSDIVSTLVYKILLIVSVSFIILMGTIALAIFLSYYLSESYLGFLAVAGIYFFVFLILITAKKLIKRKVKESVLTQILN